MPGKYIPEAYSICQCTCSWADTVYGNTCFSVLKYPSEEPKATSKPESLRKELLVEWIGYVRKISDFAYYPVISAVIELNFFMEICMGLCSEFLAKEYW